MKTKPILIILAVLAVLTAGTFYIKAHFFGQKKGPAEVNVFLERFNRYVTNQNTDSLATCFDSLVYRQQSIKQFVKVLVHQSGVEPGSKPLLKLDLNIKASIIEPNANNNEFTVFVPAHLTAPDNTVDSTTFTIKLHPATPSGYSISEVDNKDFIKDYVVAENRFKTKSIPETDIYLPITLKAFETAEKLKTKYDTVVWFSHVNNQTYYYVAQGKWDEYLAGTDSVKGYKMGLLDPQLKEIVPTQYDLVYQIGGTFKNLIEVEQDKKRGFYNLDGKLVVPVVYDQILPVTGDQHLAALRKDNTYYWLEKDYTISGEANVSAGDLFAMLPPVNAFTLTHPHGNNITELNSRDYHSSVLISPSYLTDLNLFPAIKHLENPLRKNVSFEDASSKYQVKADLPPAAPADTSRFMAVIYSIRDYFIGGRSEFYDSKNLVLVDKQHNRIYSKDILSNYTMSDGGGELSGKCNEFAFTPLADSLYELKATATTPIKLHDDSFIQEMPVYHYLYVSNNKLKEKETNRIFSFTKFVKMTDSYIHGDYLYNDKVIHELTPAMLQYMKNEIYADYNYKFKDTKWNEIFNTELYSNYKSERTSVDDLLTDIDRYNINWISQKLKSKTSNTLVAR